MKSFKLLILGMACFGVLAFLTSAQASVKVYQTTERCDGDDGFCAGKAKAGETCTGEMVVLGGVRNCKCTCSPTKKVKPTPTPTPKPTPKPTGGSISTTIDSTAVGCVDYLEATEVDDSTADGCIDYLLLNDPGLLYE